MAQARKENEKFPPYLVKCELREDLREEAEEQGLVAYWRSRTLLVQIYDRGTDVFRLSVSRAEAGSGGRWKDGISWDQLQAVKREVGYGHLEGFEAYPADQNIVNVANIRHIWIFKNQELPFSLNDRRSVKSPEERIPMPLPIWIDDAPLR